MPDGMICNDPKCQQTDDDPGFHLFVNVRIAKFEDGAPDTVVFHEHDQDQNGWVNYHHDCAASLTKPDGNGGEVPAHPQVVVMMQHIAGHKGDELRALLQDPTHPVHQAVRDHVSAEAERIHQENLAILAAQEAGDPLPDIDPVPAGVSVGVTPTGGNQ